MLINPEVFSILVVEVVWNNQALIVLPRSVVPLQLDFYNRVLYFMLLWTDLCCDKWLRIGFMLG